MKPTPAESAYRAAMNRQEWDSVAAGCEEWSDVFEHGGQVLSDRLIALAHILPGQRVLDIATGIGEPAVRAAQRVGPQGHVVAIDQSPPMLALAQARAQTRHVTNITFAQQDVTQLDVPARRFDAVLCRWGLMYLDDPGGVLTKIYRCLVPGGYFAAAVWATGPKVPLLSVPLAVIAQHRHFRPAHGPGPFSLANAYGLEQAVTQTGFDRVHSETLPLTFVFDSADAYRRYVEAVSPALGAVLAGCDGAQTAQLWHAITTAVSARYGAADGTVAIPAETICIVGQRKRDASRMGEEQIGS